MAKNTDSVIDYLNSLNKNKDKVIDNNEDKSNDDVIKYLKEKYKNKDISTNPKKKIKKIKKADKEITNPEQFMTTPITQVSVYEPTYTVDLNEYNKLLEPIEFPSVDMVNDMLLPYKKIMKYIKWGVICFTAMTLINILSFIGNLIIVL